MIFSSVKYQITSFFRVFFFVLALLASLTRVNAQDAYEIRHSYNGVDSTLYGAYLESTAQRVKDFFTEDNIDFDIVGHHYYHIRNYGTYRELFDEDFASAGGAEAAQRHFFLLIAKSSKGDALQYRIRLELPDVGPYAALGAVDRLAIEREVSRALEAAAEAEGHYIEFNQLVEVAALKRLLELLRAFKAGTLELDNFKAAGYRAVPIDFGHVAVYPGQPVAQTGTDGAVSYADYSGILLDAGTEVILQRDILLQGTDLAVDTLFSFQSFLYLLTNDQTSPASMQAAADAYRSSSRKLIVWMHYVSVDGATDSLYLKSRDNYNLPQAEELVNYFFERSMNRWTSPAADPVLAVRAGDDEMKSGSNCFGNCGASWQWGKHCLLSSAANGCFDAVAGAVGMDSPEYLPYYRFYLGFEIGLLDGILGTVELVAQASSSWVDYLIGPAVTIAAYSLELVDHYVVHRSFEKLMGKISDDAQAVLDEQLDSINQAYQVAKEIYNFVDGVTTEMVQQFIKLIGLEILRWAEGFIDRTVTGDPSAGYDVGLLAFEVITGALSGGSATVGKAVGKAGAKFLPKVLKFLKNLRLPGKSSPMAHTDGLYRLLQDAFGKARGFTNSTVSAERTVARKATRTKIKFGGCFIAGTLVAVPAPVPAVIPDATVPIEDIQLLDYVLTNTSVNSTEESYWLSDPLASVEVGDVPISDAGNEWHLTPSLDSANWYGVVFESQASSTEVHLALHRTEIKEHNYRIGAVVTLDIPEQGVNEPFRITSLKHVLPQKRPHCEDPEYTYAPVMARFIHRARPTVRLDLSDGTSLEATPNHPLYSVTHADWRPAGTLQPGDRLLTKSGEVVVRRLSERRGGTVYNLEVGTHHNFLVGSAGVVAHNSCKKNSMEGSAIDKVNQKINQQPEEVREQLDNFISSESADRATTRGKKLTWPEILRLFARGNNFDRKAQRERWWPVNQVTIEHPIKVYPTGHKLAGQPRRFRLDSYDHNEGLRVSRKATSFDEISEKTWVNYLKEIESKYPVGAKIIRPLDNNLNGKALQGQKYIEVPASNIGSANESLFRTLASQNQVTILFKDE